MAARKTFKGDKPPPHGNINRYRYHDKCRCELCTWANRIEKRVQRTGSVGKVPDRIRVRLWRAKDPERYNEYMRLYRQRQPKRR